MESKIELLVMMMLLTTHSKNSLRALVKTLSETLWFIETLFYHKCAQSASQRRTEEIHCLNREIG